MVFDCGHSHGASCIATRPVLLCRYMDTLLEQLLADARRAVSDMRASRISYDECRVIVDRYIAEANKRGRELAKKHGMRFKPMSAIGFMR